MEHWLVVGGTGMAGFGVVKQLCREGHSVTVLTRQTPSLSSLPLLSEAAPGIKLVQGSFDGGSGDVPSLSGLGITHLFYSAFVGGRKAKDGKPICIPESNKEIDQAEKSLPCLLNVLPLCLRQKVVQNLVSVVAQKQDLHLEEENEAMLSAAVHACGDTLMHVVLCCGGKMYGHHLGPLVWPDYTSPFREDMRAPGPNFYLGQLRALKGAITNRRQELTATVLFPSMIVGPVAQLQKGTMNIALCLAAYATLCRELQMPLKFPSLPSVYKARWSISPSSRIAQLALQASRRRELYSTAAQELHLIASCGGAGTWQEVWPKLGRHFGVEVEGPDSDGHGLDLQAMFAGKDVNSAWAAALSRGGCSECALDVVLNWDFLSNIMLVRFDAEYGQQRCEELNLADDHTAWEGLKTALLDLEEQGIIPTTPQKATSL